MRREASGRPFTLVIALTVIYAYAFTDRVILGLLVDPIKASLRLTDLQMGVLLGLAFAALYALANLPAGYLVDRLNRRRLIATAALVWGGMTLVCAASGGFSQMFAGRAGVGLAEAVMAPAAFSLIRDRLPPRLRGAGFSVYATGPLIGGAAALIGGGALLHAARIGALGGVLAALGLSTSISPWRVALGVVGLLGLPVTLLLLTFPEPPRDPAAPAGTTAETLAHLRHNIAIYLPLVAYVTFGAMMSFGQSAWLPATLGRKWGIPPERIGPMLGGITLVCGVLGLLLTGLLLRAMAARGRDIRSFGALAAVCTACGLAAAALAPSFPLSLAAAGFGLFFVGASFPIGATTLAQIAPAGLMGRITGGYLMLQTLMGQSLGPLLIALAATHVFGGRAGLAQGFAAMMALFGLATLAAAIALRARLAPRRPPSLPVAAASE